MVLHRISHGNKNFHESLRGIYTTRDLLRVDNPRYTYCNTFGQSTRDLPRMDNLLYHVWTIYTWTIHMRIHKNDNWHNKPRYGHAGRWIVANYVVLSVTLYFASIEMPSKFDGEYAGSQQLKSKKPHQAVLVSTLYSHQTPFYSA